MITLFVKKIVSLSPDLFDFVELDKAIESYDFYVHSGGVKGFEEWCATEI